MKTPIKSLFLTGSAIMILGACMENSYVMLAGYIFIVAAVVKSSPRTIDYKTKL